MDEQIVTVVTAGDTLPGRLATVGSSLAGTIEVIGHASTGTDAVGHVLADLPDVLLLDAAIENTDARAVCRRIREWAPATRVLAATRRDDEHAYTTVVSGAFGAVLAEADDVTVAAAIRSVSRGEAIVLPRIAVRLLHDVDAWAARSADPLHPPPTLTATEREVLARLGDGVAADVLAESHGVTARLVNLHAGFAVAKLHRYVLGASTISVTR